MNNFDYEDDLYRERMPNICDAMSNRARSCCTTKTLKRYVPVLDWLPKYRAKYLLVDFVAGLTVGLTAIPQAIAYGVVAGLPAQYGLYSAFMGCFMYIIFGTCKDITVGPTAIMALMVQPHVTLGADYAVLLSFMSGCIILLLGLLHLGILVRFISIPVTTGFTMAAAITIGSSQINGLFGIQSPTNEFIGSWKNFFTHITETRLNDALLGCCTLILLLLMRKVRDIKCRYRNVVKYISLSRNALAVIIGILLCYFLKNGDSLPFRVSGKITPGLPPFKPPPFSTTVDGANVSFKEMIDHLGSSLITIPLISILESIAVAKAFSKGKIVNATQEMIALGICNILGGFVSSMSTTGSFSRTAINNASGVKTQLGGAVTGALVLMTLAFLTSTFSYIPKATLAAIIIAAMIFMVEYDRIAEIWRAKKRDILVLVVTVTCCLFWSLEYGMVCGIFFNMLYILYKSMKANLTIEKVKVDGNEVIVAELNGNIDYAAAETLKTVLLKYVGQITAENSSNKFVVLDGSEISSIDSTVAFNICELREDLSLLKYKLICWNWTVPTAGVVCRLDSEMRQMFKFGKSLTEILTPIIQQNSV